MTKEQKDAHLRMVSSLPSTTHYVNLPEERMHGRRIGDKLPQYLLEEVRDCIKQGMTRRAIIETLHIGQRTYNRIRDELAQEQEKEAA